MIYPRLINLINSLRASETVAFEKSASIPSDLFKTSNKCAILGRRR